MSEKFVTPIGDNGLYILDTSSWRVNKPIIDNVLCINCGICIAFCPVNSIHYDENNNTFIDYSYCKGCGICNKECPKKAITMKEE